GDATGGKGGALNIAGTLVQGYPTTTFSSGTGGDARIWCSETATPGTASGVEILPDGNFQGFGVVDGGGGRVLIEPVTITGGRSFIIQNTSEVIIFGGNGAKIVLNNLSANAISSEGDIILSVGEGGTIDLRNNAAKIFNSTNGTVKIYADKVLLDEGVSIEELANVNVELQPAKILYAVTLTGTGIIDGDANATIPITVRVQNSGPTTDIYTLSVKNSEGWQVSGLPNTITVDGLKSKELTLQVTLSKNPGEVNDVTVTATSQTDATAIASMKTQVIVKGELVVEPEKVALTITQPTDGTVSAEGIDCGGDCTEDYEVNSEVALTATPNEGYNFNDWQGDCAGTTAELTVTLDEAKSCTATFAVIEIPNKLPTAALAITPETGEAPLTIALNGSTSTDTDGNIVSYAWTANGQTANGQNAELTFNDAGNYTITLKVTDNDGATDQVQKTVIVQEIPNKLPTAALAITPESGEAPLTVALDGSASTDTDGNIVSYAWTANGQTANGQNAELTFNDARDYTITLKVTDNDGATKSATKNVKVEAAGKYAASGTIRDEEDNPIAGVSVQVGKKTAVTDATGYWEINSLQEGNYEVIATKDGYTFPVKECALGNNENCSPKIKPDSVLDIKVVPNSWKPAKQGENVSYAITVTNQGEKTATGVMLTDSLPEGTTLVSLEAVDGGSCEADTVTCTLPDLTPGATATAKVVISNAQAKALVNKATVTANEYPDDVQTTWTAVKPYLSVTLSDTPDPIITGGTLHYTADVDLNQYAPKTTATGVELVMQLPKGVELKSVNTDYGLCDTSKLPTLICELTDLSIDSPDAISHITVHADVLLNDPGLLLLTHEAKVTANEYPAHTDRERTSIVIPEGVEVDIAFVIDVTGSMQEEINSVIKALKGFIAEIEPSNAPLVALIVFTDDVKIEAFTGDLNVLLGAVEKLKAAGGGTCPEASVEALLIAVPHTKEGGDILFATDASPYADADVEKVMALLRGKGIRFNAMITGDCSNESDWNQLPE
ncbi:MAG: PKD domain-containing protein, partial [Candidatus Parabeggiatoa sp.]|nr:PKD domain-containing protein [Candidatus Parabeggiatoa sp.]